MENRERERHTQMHRKGQFDNVKWPNHELVPKLLPPPLCDCPPWYLLASSERLAIEMLNELGSHLVWVVGVAVHVLLLQEVDLHRHSPYALLGLVKFVVGDCRGKGQRCGNSALVIIHIWSSVVLSRCIINSSPKHLREGAIHERARAGQEGSERIDVLRTNQLLFFFFFFLVKKVKLAVNFFLWRAATNKSIYKKTCFLFSNHPYVN